MTSLRHVPRFLQSVRHTRPRQLAARAYLLAKRHTLSRLGPRAPLSPVEGATDLPVTVRRALPSPPLPPRRGHVRSVTDGVQLHMLNQTYSLGSPAVWRPVEHQHGTRLFLLHLHYMEFLEELDDADVVRLVLDWIEQVRPFTPHYWLDTWNSYSLSIRVVVWMQQLARRRIDLESRTGRRIVQSLVEQLLFLERNLETDIGGNHLIKNIKALLWAGAFFEGSVAERWRGTGERLLGQELQRQVLADGMHFELSPAYHAQVLADLLDVWAVLRPGKLEQTLRQTLQRMMQCLVDLTQPDGHVSLFNDGGLHSAYEPEVLRETYARLSSGAAPEPRRVIEYPHAGYFGYRDSVHWLLIDCGALAPDSLPAHGHGDALAFEWSVRGQRVIVDAGVFEYNEGPRRAYSRATRSHNTLTLDDLDQSEFWKSFRVGRRARITHREISATSDRLRLVGEHDGYRRLAGAPVHRRELQWEPGKLAIHDVVRGGAGQVAVARLLLHPDCTLELTSEHEAVVGFPGGRMRIHASGRLRSREAAWHPDMGVEILTRQLECEYGPAPIRGDMRLEVETDRRA